MSAQDIDAALAEVLAQFGRRVVDRPEQLRGALSDTLGASAGDHRSEVDAVVAASRAGVAGQIRDADPAVAASPEQIRAWLDQIVSAGASLRDAALATRSWAEVFDASETARVTSQVSSELLGKDAAAPTDERKPAPLLKTNALTEEATEGRDDSLHVDDPDRTRVVGGAGTAGIPPSPEPAAPPHPAPEPVEAVMGLTPIVAGAIGGGLLVLTGLWQWGVGQVLGTDLIGLTVAFAAIAVHWFTRPDVERRRVIGALMSLSAFLCLVLLASTLGAFDRATSGAIAAATFVMAAEEYVAEVSDGVSTIAFILLGVSLVACGLAIVAGHRGRGAREAVPNQGSRLWPTIAGAVSVVVGLAMAVVGLVVAATGGMNLSSVWEDGRGAWVSIVFGQWAWLAMGAAYLGVAFELWRSGRGASPCPSGTERAPT